MGREPTDTESRTARSTKTESFAEPHFTVGEIAEMWKLSEDAVRRLFQDEPGVFVLGSEKPSSARRRYTTLRIPASVVERVHRRLLKG